MITFRDYTLSRTDSLSQSLAFVGRYVTSVNENAGVEDVQNHPEAKVAMQFIYDIAAKFKEASSHITDLVKQLGKDPTSVVSTLKVKVQQIAQDFQQKLGMVKQKAQAVGANVSEGVLDAVGKTALKGLRFLVQKILGPVIKWLLTGIKKTVVNVLMVPVQGFENSKFHGLVDGICALLLTVLLWPYAVTIGGLAVAPVGGGIFMWTVTWWFLMWFKYNILTPALKYTDGGPEAASV